jgi:ribosomal protein S27E
METARRPTEEASVPEENVIRIMCPNLGCRRILAVPGHARGKLVRCRSCGTTIRIPQKAKEPVDTGEQQKVPPAAQAQQNKPESGAGGDSE